MSRKTWTVGLATLGVALICAVSLGACRPAPGRRAVVETGGARPALPDSTSVTLQSAPAASAAPTPLPPASVPMRSLEQEQDTSRMRSRPAQEQDTSRARYPKEWDVSIPAGTRLDSLRRDMDALFATLPPKDLEDRSPLPIWFRVYLRKRNPGLSTHGPYQYPRTAGRLLQWMVAHPDSVER